MKTQSYTLENITYGFCRNARKWKFNSNGNTFITKCPGGKETADKIAVTILASSKRAKSKHILDGIARKTINDKILTEA